MEAERSRLMKAAWDAVADDYHDYWTPRFEPLVRVAIDRFEPAPLGALAVPGCGPGNEVYMLAQRFPERSILATDVSSAMIALLNRRLREDPRPLVLATLGHAEDLSNTIREAAGIFSCFHLQLAPDHLATLKDWALSLRRGGWVTVLFWPRPHEDDPFGRLLSILETHTGETRPDWVDATRERLSETGLELVLDEPVEKEIMHSSPEECFRKIVDAGPLQLAVHRHGREVVEACGQEWLRHTGMQASDGVWVQQAHARIWCLRKS